jgi:putative lipoprotein (rSAM/lipoprotein system)
VQNWKDQTIRAPIGLRFLKSPNSLSFILISILGFSLSCKQEQVIIDFSAPKAVLVVKGEIVSAIDSSLVPNIFIEMRGIKKDESGQSESPLMDSDFTDSNGDYRLSDSYDSVVDHTYQIKVTDTDGMFNGQYETLDTLIVFRNLKFTGGDEHWSLSPVEKVVNLKLKPKK